VPKPAAAEKTAPASAPSSGLADPNELVTAARSGDVAAVGRLLEQASAADLQYENKQVGITTVHA
jgi:hypothetical protein